MKCIGRDDHAGGSCLRCQPRDNGSGLSDQLSTMEKWLLLLAEDQVNKTIGQRCTIDALIAVCHRATICRARSQVRWSSSVERMVLSNWAHIPYYILTRRGWKKASPLPFIYFFFILKIMSVNMHDNTFIHNLLYRSIGWSLSKF